MLMAVADVVNEFSWSRTRDNAFQECRRRYYYQYYGAWGGWDAGADPVARRLYVLKQLGTRQMWAGRLVHEAIERSLLALRHGYALSEASLIEDTVRQMREEWKGSRDGAYRESPKRTGLFEHEYRVPVKAGEWQALRDHVVRCLRNFHRLSVLADIKRAPTDRWILIEDIGSFPWEDTRVFTAPDFAYWNEADRLQLLDWKTGGNGANASLQLGGYALYALEVLRVDLPRVDLYEVNLREGRITAHPWDEASLDRVREHLRLSMRSMKAYLRDPGKNTALEGGLREGRGPAPLPLVQFPRGLPPRPPALPGGMKGMKALLIDLDDTLLDYSGGVDDSWRLACAVVAAPAGIDPAVLVPAIARSRRWFWDDADRHRRERVDMMGAWTRIAAHALAEFVDDGARLAGQIAERFAAHRWERMCLFPGVNEALDRLRGRGIPLGLVTNGDRRQQRRKIEQYDLERHFDVIVIEGEFGAGKPDEAVYRHALAALATRPEDAWMVGDNLEWDVAAPQRLGLRGVWVDAPGHGLPASEPVVPHRIIRAFPELVAE